MKTLAIAFFMAASASAQAAAPDMTPRTCVEPTKPVGRAYAMKDGKEVPCPACDKSNAKAQDQYANLYRAHKYWVLEPLTDPRWFQSQEACERYRDHFLMGKPVLKTEPAQ